MSKKWQYVLCSLVMLGLYIAMLIAGVDLGVARMKKNFRNSNAVVDQEHGVVWVYDKNNDVYRIEIDSLQN